MNFRHRSAPAAPGTSRRIGRLRALAALAATVAAPFAAGGPAAGQGAAGAESARGDAVMNRPRPEYDPIGVPLPVGDPTVVGNTLLFPNLTLSTGWTDNVYRSDRDTRSDFFATVAPRLTLRTGDDMLDLSLDLAAEARRYLEETENDYIDFGAQAGVGYEVLPDVRLAASGGWQRQHEDRSSPDSAQAGDSVTTLNDLSGRASVEAAFGDLRFLASGAAVDRTYNDDGAVPAEFRDRTSYDATGRFAWEFQPGLAAFVQPSYNWVRYDRAVGPDGLLQDNEGWQVLAGLGYDVSAVSYAEVGIGYRSQSFDDPSLETAAGLALNAEVLWNATEMMTLSLEAQRSVDQTTIAGASSSVTTEIALGLDYELRYDLLLETSVGYSVSDFGDIEREDQDVLARVGLLYLINEYASAELAYAFEARESDAPDADLVANTVTFGLRLQY
jgi:hypothetical protein